MTRAHLCVAMQGRDAVRHTYFSVSPYPKEPDLMPTFPTRHDDMMSSEGGREGGGAWRGEEESSRGSDRAQQAHSSSRHIHGSDSRASTLKSHRVDSSSSSGSRRSGSGASRRDSSSGSGPSSSLGKRTIQQHYSASS
jgi:hypothetical protein